jgi:hypothetical protein
VRDKVADLSRSPPSPAVMPPGALASSRASSRPGGEKNTDTAEDRRLHAAGMRKDFTAEDRRLQQGNRCSTAARTVAAGMRKGCTAEDRRLQQGQ